jgi:hypothetical protein
MTLFDASRTFMHKHVQHGLGTCWRYSSSLHRMYILLCFLLLVTGFYPVWFGHCGFLEMKKRRSGKGHLLHAPRWCTERGLRTGLKMAHVLCRHVVPGVGSVGSPGFYAVCKSNRCEDGMTCARTSGRCHVSSACCGMDAGAATAAMREDDRDEDLVVSSRIASYYLSSVYGR